jgi:hypothetical protein
MSMGNLCQGDACCHGGHENMATISAWSEILDTNGPKEPQIHAGAVHHHSRAAKVGLKASWI